GNSDAAVDADPVSGVQWTSNSVTSNGTNNAIAPNGSPSIPASSVSSALTALVGNPVTFTMNLTGGSGTLSHVLWDFGEGTPSTLLSPMHTYAAPGSYRVTMLAWDSAGEASMNEVTMNVVTAVPEPSGALPLSLIAVGGALGIVRRGHSARP